MKKMLIIHTWGIGDMIMFSPFLSEIKKQYSDYLIDFFITQKGSIIPIEKSSLVNDIFVSDYQIKNLLSTIRLLKKNNYEICFHTSGISPLKIFIFSLFLKKNRMYGEYWKYKNPFYTKQVKLDLSIHRFESNKKLLSLFMDTNEIKPSPKFYLDDNDKQFAEEYVQNSIKNNKILFGIHPGCNKNSLLRRWPKEHFVEVILYLNKKYQNIDVIVFVGPDEEEDGKYIQEKTNVMIAKNFSLSKVAAIISKCTYFLNTDSGLGHIASCFYCLIFTIFGPANPVLTKPLSNKSVIIKSNLQCQPCEVLNPTHCQVSCLNDLKPLKVIQVIDKYIK